MPAAKPAEAAASAAGGPGSSRFLCPVAPASGGRGQRPQGGSQEPQQHHPRHPAWRSLGRSWSPPCRSTWWRMGGCASGSPRPWRAAFAPGLGGLGSVTGLSAAAADPAVAGAGIPAWTARPLSRSSLPLGEAGTAGQGHRTHLAHLHGTSPPPTETPTPSLLLLCELVWGNAELGQRAGWPGQEVGCVL